MELLNKYIELSNNKETFDKYTQTGEGMYGKTFKFMNTNYRYIKSILTNYNTFKEVDGVDRSEWEVARHGQEKLKQHTVNMLQMKLFSKNDRVYYKTRKGEVLEKINDNFSEEEKWFIIYLLILDSYFCGVPNYILTRTKEVIENFMITNIEEKELVEIIKKFIIMSSSLDICELFKEDYMYFDSFYMTFKDGNFLNLYVESTKEQKEELWNYIIKNYKEKSYNCILSKKYKPSGVFDRGMIRDNAKLLFMSQFINRQKEIGFKDFIDNLINRYALIETFDSGKIKQFIYINRDVFEMIYYNIFDIDILEISSQEEIKINEQEENRVLNNEEHLDKTSAENIKELKRISSVLKKKAKERANYKCELEDSYMCQNHYFTSKETHKNYMEIHHLIPREFSNDFERSIEIIENYVCLCPRCHRLIHLAVDRERKTAINQLFNRRVNELQRRGLNISVEQMKDYYGIKE